jgi:hypothetical protein
LIIPLVTITTLAAYPSLMVMPKSRNGGTTLSCDRHQALGVLRQAMVT